ncbi:MAG: restriction endonuclease [Clostridiales bacterium]|nr:restriction endonuclease [Clostridiales bacterium]
MSDNLFNKVYNPDVLSCLANLSNDEVFTPPEIVNQMLDMLPQELFRNPDTTFLDPACKTGVFLREIAKRLIKGLEPQFPDLQERIDHIFHKQLFGIAITELTSLLSRRGIYCSKYPNSDFSVTKFDTAQGNIRFKRIDHTWVNGRCKYCGTNRTYDRGEELETHAYEFIHTDNLEKLFNMKFDVIIGNPPYQMSDGGNGASAMPIYHYFVEQAKKLNPKYMSFIIPARWYAGGRGLDTFRKIMLEDKRICELHDFPNSPDCFPGVQIEGGVCYFLWDKNYNDKCNIYTHSKNDIIAISNRYLLEDFSDTFIRYSEQITILTKVKDKTNDSFIKLVKPNDAFGYDVRVENTMYRVKPSYMLTSFNDAVKFYYFGWKKEGVGYVESKSIRKGHDLIEKWKVLISRAYGMGNSYPTQVINKPFVVEPRSCCTETYTVIGPFKSKVEAENVVSYIETKFFRFMVLILKSTQSAPQKVYQFVPMQDFSKSWTDEELYEKYGLTQEEIDFIESMIRPMD